MKKKISVCVDREANNLRIEQYMKRCLYLTPAQIRSLKFQPGGVMKNHEPCRVKEVFKEGDLLEITWNDEKKSEGKIKASGHFPDILYEDEDVICIWKPSGQVTHPVAGHGNDSVSADLVTYFASRGENSTAHSIGRLDKDTAGILAFARHRIAAEKLWKQKEQGILQKEYLAWCRGVFPKEAGDREQKIEVPIAKMPAENGQGQKMQTVRFGEGKEAVTFYQVIEQREDRALLRLRLKTGRTHQIRVHMASIGHPLVGDSLYADGVPHRDTARLCAWKVSFLQPFTKEEICLSSGEDPRRMTWWKSQEDRKEAQHDTPCLPIS